MKKPLIALALGFSLISITEIVTANTLVTIVKKRTMADDERNVSGFKGISSSGSYDVRITMGNKESLRLEGDNDVIKGIETVVENGILKIRNRNRNNWSWGSRDRVTIFITAKTLNSLTLSGSGDIVVKGVVKASRLTNTLSGSGSITLSADADEYISTINGSGEITVRGRADKATIKIGGSGDFEGQDLKTSVADIKVSGSGDASIFVDKTLNAAVSGSGDITYDGNAKVNKTKSGSGSISKF